MDVLEDDHPRRRPDGGGEQLDREVADRVGPDVGLELRDARRDDQLDRQDRVEKRCALEQDRVAAEAGEHGGLDHGVVGRVGEADVERLEQRTAPDVVRRRSLDRVGLAEVDPHRRHGARLQPADQLGLADTGLTFEDHDPTVPGRGKPLHALGQAPPLRGPADQLASSGPCDRLARACPRTGAGRSRGLDAEGLDPVRLALELKGAKRSGRQSRQFESRRRGPLRRRVGADLA